MESARFRDMSAELSDNVFDGSDDDDDGILTALFAEPEPSGLRVALDKLHALLRMRRQDLEYDVAKRKAVLDVYVQRTTSALQRRINAAAVRHRIFIRRLQIMHSNSALLFRPADAATPFLTSHQLPGVWDAVFLPLDLGDWARCRLVSRAWRDLLDDCAESVAYTRLRADVETKACMRDMRRMGLELARRVRRLRR